MDIPFTGGVDQTTRAELVAAPSFAQLVNLRQVKRGAYQKRYGYTLLSNVTFAGGPTVPACKRLLAYKDELLQTDGLSLYTRGITGHAWKQIRGLTPQLQITNQPALPLQFIVEAYDIVCIGGYHVVVYAVRTSGIGTTGSCIFGAVVDATSGTIVSPPVNISGAIGTGTSLPLKLVLVSCDNKAVLVYAKDAEVGPNLRVSTIDLTTNATINAGWSAPSAFITDAYTDGGANHLNRFDVCSLGSTFVVAYVNSTSGGTYPNAIGAAGAVTVRTFDSSLVQQATTTVAACSGGGTGVEPTAVSVDGSSSDVIWVAFTFDGGANVDVTGLHHSTLAITWVIGTIIVTASAGAKCVNVAHTGNGTGCLVVSGHADDDLYIANFGTSFGFPQIIGTAFRTFFTVQDSRQFSVGGRWYMTVRYSDLVLSGSVSPNPDDLWLIDITQTLADQLTASSHGYLRLAGHINPRLTFGSPVVEGVGPHVSALSTTKVILPVPAKKNAVASSLDFATLDYAPSNAWAPSILGETVAMNGAPTSYYDGTRVQEVGFVQRPKIDLNTCSGASGLTGAYSYIAVYEQIDARGQWHQSNISDVFTVTSVPANQGVNPYVRTLRITNRMDVATVLAVLANQVRIALYRNKGPGGVFGTIFYRVPSSERINDPSTALLIMGPDTTPDASLGAELYSQPGIPGSAQVKVDPPSFSCMIAHSDRLIGAVGKTVWYSGQTVYGEGYWFSDLFQFAIETGGDITGLASMDGALVVFKRAAIAFVDGQGPGDNGAGGDFTPPQFVATDLGCMEQRSIVVTSLGTMFKSIRGIELLSRGRQLAPFFGQFVQDATDLFPVVTSAVLDEQKGVVLFTCVASEDPGDPGAYVGTVLVYDLVLGVWTIDTVALDSLSVTKSAIMWGQNPGTTPVRTVLGLSGGVYQESTVNYLDNSGWVTFTMETAWVKGAGVAGFQCAILAILQAQNLSDHDLTISVGYDFNTTYTDVQTWTAAELLLLTTQRETLQMQFSQPECTAFRLKVVDATPTGGTVGTGQGPVLFGLEIDAGANGGLVPLPQENRK